MLRLLIVALSVLASASIAMANLGEFDGARHAQVKPLPGEERAMETLQKFAARRTVYYCTTLNGMGAQGHGWSYSGFNDACSVSLNRCRGLSQGRGSCYVSNRWTRQQ